MRPSTYRQRVHHQRAFTLLELLVVISIIAVLASMLMTSIGLVRQAARSTACLTNLRMMGLAAQSYATDWEGQLVPAFWSDAAGGTAYALPWVTNTDFLTAYADSSGVVNPFAVTGVVPAKLLCPEQLPRNPSHWLKFSYGLNWSAPGYSKSGPTYPASSAIAPRTGQVRSEVVMFADALDWLMQSAYAGTWTATLEQTIYAPSVISYRHRQRSAIVCYDGSATTVPMSEMTPATTRWK